VLGIPRFRSSKASFGLEKSHDLRLVESGDVSSPHDLRLVESGEVASPHDLRLEESGEVASSNDLLLVESDRVVSDVLLLVERFMLPESMILSELSELLRRS
jgi:hypothetical protein